MDWKEAYRTKLVTAAEAVRVVRSGNLVVCTIGGEPRDLIEALVQRRDELSDVRVLLSAPQGDYGWFEPGPSRAFSVTLESTLGPFGRAFLQGARSDFAPSLMSLFPRIFEDGDRGRREIDVFMTPVSPPDENGYCSFGESLWNKKTLARRAKVVIGEVRSEFPRTLGDNFIHASEIDCFAEATSPPSPRHAFPLPQEDVVRKISQYLSALIHDGDTLQVGVGTCTTHLAKYGALDGKNDLGIHTEEAFAGISKLVKKGIITGDRKSVNRGKVIATSFMLADEDDIAMMADNPSIELHGVEYVNDPRVIAAHDNMIAINSALCVDLYGQISAETMSGPAMWNGAGGQPEFVFGSLMAKGGRSVTVLQSTAKDGTVSRIVPQFERGMAITVPRYLADHVVTEYGVARLLGKGLHERARELISIAHPKFRDDLERATRELSSI